MKAWSYSAMKNYMTCPRKYHAEVVEKLYPFEKSEAIIYGEEVHKVCEDYIGKGTPVPEGHKQFKPALDSLNKLKGDKHCELRMALNTDLEPVDFFAKDVWVRGVVDLLIIDGDKARVVDYKTGKAKYPDKDQLELMALMVFQHYSDVATVKAALAFLCHDVLVKETYKRSDKDKLWKKWHDKATLLQASFDNDNWPPKTNGLCRNYCNVLHCEFNGKN